MSKFYQTVIPAEPGTHTLFVDEDGSLRKGDRVIGWAIERFHDRGYGESACTIATTITAHGDTDDSGFVLMPDGRVEGPWDAWVCLDEANAPDKCAERVRREEKRAQPRPV